MAIDEDPFPLMASINTASSNLRVLIESKKEGELSPINVWVLKYLWVLKYCMIHVDKLKNEWSIVCPDPL